MFDRIYVHYWMSLDKPVREYLAKVFNINRTGIVEIRDETVLTDGYNNDDLSVVTKETLALYTGDSLDNSFSQLWELTVLRAQSELNPPKSTEGEVATTERYCLTCTSTKGRHKKGCPKFK